MKRLLVAPLLGLVFAMPAMAIDPSSRELLDQSYDLINQADQLTRYAQQQGQKYQAYVYTHLVQACNVGDRSACQEYQCRANELSLRASLAVESSRYRLPAALPKTGINCGAVRYRW